MKWFLALALLLLVACTQTPRETTDSPATGPTDTPNLPAQNGELEVSGTGVQYHGNTTGYYVRPKGAQPYPGVVMIHEWWGLNDNIKAMADQLASEGYAVLAVDLFGRVATTPDEARNLTGGFNQTEGLANMRDAVAFLEAQDVTSVGSLGWCFGGAQSLQLGLNEDLDATVMYYGNVVTDPGNISRLEQPVLGIFGATDQSIPVAKVQEFDQALDAQGVDNQIHIYPGVGHAFANPSGANYNAPAAEDAWAKTVAFLNQNLQ
jgi:carboxymethylenebutenolidase